MTERAVRRDGDDGTLPEIRVDWTKDLRTPDGKVRHDSERPQPRFLALLVPSKAASGLVGRAKAEDSVALREVIVTTPASRSAWTECCERDETHLVTQSPAWTDAMTSTGRWSDASRLYSFSDGRSVVLPLVHRARVGPVAPRYSMPDAWGFGGLVGASIDASTVASVVADLRGVRCGWVRIRPNPIHASSWEAGASAGDGATLALPRRAHVLRLDLGVDEIFRSRFTSACRRAIRSAEKSGITVEVDTTGRLVPVFHSLFRRSVDRWATSQHEPQGLARFRAERRDPRAKFEAWAGALGDACRVLVARRDAQPIAALIVLQGRNAHMTRGAMDRELVGNDRPNELLMWRAIQDAVAAGCGWFHMGESGESQSLARYKEKYGAVPVGYAEHRIERFPATALDAALRSGVKRVIGFRDT